MGMCMVMSEHLQGFVIILVAVAKGTWTGSTFCLMFPWLARSDRPVFFIRG